MHAALWILSGSALLASVVGTVGRSKGALLDEYRRKRALAAVNRQHRTSWS